MVDPSAMYSIEEGNIFEPSQLNLRRTHKVKIEGSGNSVEVGRNSIISGMQIHVRGTGNRIIIGRNCGLRGQILMKGNNQTLRIGDFTTTVDAYFLCFEDKNITVGSHCMFSREIEVRTSDSHSLIDKASGQRINKASSVYIGNHVWVSVGAIINKGAFIPDDCIIGAGAFVAAKFEKESCTIAGTPAKVLRENVTWHRSRADEFSPERMNNWRRHGTGKGEGA